MTVEDQLREYRATLDATTEEAAASHTHRIAPPIRIRPARTLLVAAVAVAAAIGVAFAVVGTTHKSSTPPAGVTTTPPPSTTAPTPTTPTTTTPRTTPATLTLPVRVCDTLEAIAGGTSRPPNSIMVPAARGGDPVSGFADKQGRLVVTAPASWTCAAVDAGDGGASLELPADSGKQSGSDFNPASPSDHDGLFALSIPTCQGCVYSEICGIVPNADADVPGFKGTCAARPAGEKITSLGNNVYRIEDPAGAVTPDAAISILVFHPSTSTTDASVARETCAFQHQLDICAALLNQFLALQTPSWMQPALTMTPTSLGAVRVGMTKNEAQTAAGVSFDGSGDGFSYPTTLPTDYPHEYVGLGGPNGTVVCVGATIAGRSTAPQTISTPEGFRLGDTVDRLLAVYGDRARFVPAPSSGMTTNAGYVVTESSGNLAFVVDDQQRIVEMAGGGTDLGPNSCTG